MTEMTHMLEKQWKLTSGGSSGLGVEFRDQVVRRLRNNGAEDAGDVTCHEGDSQLLVLAALRLGLGDHILIQSFHGVLEAGKLHHGVGYLAAPQRLQTLVEPAKLRHSGSLTTAS